MNGTAAGPFLPADWPAPPGVHAFTTLRHGAGASRAPFDTFNLGNRTAADGDDPATVDANRAELVRLAGLPAVPHWLKQVHGTDVVRVEGDPHPNPPPQAGEGDPQRRVVLPPPPQAGQGDPQGQVVLPPPPRAGEGWGGGAEPVADAAVTSTPRTVLAILTADCLPVVFASEAGDEIAAAHAGWPGLSAGMLEATVAAMRTPPDRLIAWIGPCAGPQRYEIGAEVRDRFLAHDAEAARAFVPTRPGHWLVDLPAIARMRLAQVGVTRAHGGDLCTLSDPARFFSHRRDARTGRMATLAWIDR